MTSDARIVLLRGINLGPHRRVAMAELRDLLTGAGYGDVRTLLASGNVVLRSGAKAARLKADCDRLLSERFGFEIATVVRTGTELRAIVERDPLADVVDDPKRYLVTFLAGKLPKAVLDALSALDIGDDRWVADGGEIYSWHPDGIARSELSKYLAGRTLGVAGTARNWRTVNALLEMSSELEASSG